MIRRIAQVGHLSITNLLLRVDQQDLAGYRIQDQRVSYSRSDLAGTDDCDFGCIAWCILDSRAREEAALWADKM